MKKVLRFLTFLPFFRKIYERHYYASGFGILMVNLFFKHILRINSNGDILFNFTAKAHTPGNIKIIGNDLKHSVYVSFVTSGGSYYQAINGIEIGEGTIWAHGCHFISSNHSYRDLKKNLPGPPIRIGRNVWIATGCVILPGVSIGDHSVVGAGSIVTKSFPGYSIIAGNPAEIIGKRCQKCLEKIPGEMTHCKECVN
ncbi:acyltransferase [Chitinophaga tropicalis]|uniref:Acyltransferase n=1 Tax=Chitinophaga tropicalis TaxID=2683588 RepID=A0A7K1U3E4_9BACT|nr:acyltransferase [Chitinophaga tropicalis]MVT08887.1 acyltransferase [Chitinophaga tropicalis]